MENILLLPLFYKLGKGLKEIKQFAQNHHISYLVLTTYKFKTKNHLVFALIPWLGCNSSVLG